MAVTRFYDVRIRRNRTPWLALGVFVMVVSLMGVLAFILSGFFTALLLTQ